MLRLLPVRRIIGTLVSLVVLALVTPAAAAGPTREVIPAGGPITIEDLCSFPVQIVPEGKTIRLTFYDKNRSILRVIETYPGAKQTVTNLSTGKTIRIVITGPGFFDDRRAVGTGLWSWFGHPLTGEAGFYLTAGRWTYDFAAQTFSLKSGQIRNLCAELAG